MPTLDQGEPDDSQRGSVSRCLWTAGPAWAQGHFDWQHPKGDAEMRKVRSPCGVQGTLGQNGVKDASLQLA